MTRTDDGPQVPIVIFREELLPPSETFIGRQVRALRRYDPTLVGLRESPESNVNDLRCVLVGGPWARLAARAAWHRPLDDQFMRAFTKLGPRLVHAHFLTDAARVATSCRRLGLPLVVTVHGYDATLDRDVIRRSGTAGRRLVDGWREVIAATTRFIAVADHLSRRLEGLGVPREKIVTHHIGVPIAPAAAFDKRQPGTVLFVGRMVAKKGILDFVDAAARASAHRQGLSIRVAGDGPWKDRARDLASSRGLGITFLGRLSEAVVAEEMRSASLLVVPSRPDPAGDSEGLPTVVCEAMASGLPVVAYDSVGVNEAVVNGETGRLVEAGDVGALANAIVELMDSPEERRRLAGRARGMAESEFDIGKQTRILEGIYDQALTRSKQACR